MSRKHDPTQINLEVDDVRWFTNNQGDYALMDISWSSDIGFGMYTIKRDENGLKGYSECMDVNEDKAFLAELLLKLRDYILEIITICE